MRREFVHRLVDLARDDERIVLLTGDLGFAALEPFASASPTASSTPAWPSRTWWGWRPGWPRPGLTPVRVLDLDVRLDATL